MNSRRLVGAMAAFGLMGAGTGGLVIAGAASPAEAFTGTCPTTTPAATLVADGVCEVRFTTSGTFTPPTGITKLAAVLVGGGGAGGYFTPNDYAYAGSGGSVVYIDSVPLGGAVTVTVGLGGTVSSFGIDPAVGDDTSIAPDGGAGAASGGNAGGGGSTCGANPPYFSYGDGARPTRTIRPAHRASATSSRSWPASTPRSSRHPLTARMSTAMAATRPRPLRSR